MPTKAKPKDLFGDENELKPVSAKFDKVGDSYTGVYVDKRVIDDKMKDTPGAKVTIYNLLTDDGQVITVWGKFGNPRVLPGLEQARFGQYVGVKFVKEIPSSGRGKQPAKVLKVYSQGEMKMDMLEAYRAGKIGMIADGGDTDTEVPFEGNTLPPM